MCHEYPLRNLDVANLNGGVILPVAALNVVLPARFILQHPQSRAAALLYDFADYLHFRDVGGGNELLFIRAYGQHVFERYLAAQLSFERLHADGLARLDAILLSPTANYGVHAAS